MNDGMDESGKLEYLRHTNKHCLKYAISIINGKILLNDGTNTDYLRLQNFRYFDDDDHILFDYLLKYGYIDFDMTKYKNIVTKYFIKYQNEKFIKYESSYSMLKYNYINIQDNTIRCNYYNENYELVLVIIEQEFGKYYTIYF